MSTPDRPDSVDEILRRAGAAWRDTQPGPPELQQHRLLRHNGSRSARRWLPVLAAASVTAIVATAIAVLPRDAGQDAGDAMRSSLVVHDGDMVEVTGGVRADAGKPVVFCPRGLPIYMAPTKRNLPPSCPGIEVTLIGVDLDRLAEAASEDGKRWGQATLRGIWRNRTVEVRFQSAPKPLATGEARVDTVPCPPPPGGWKTSVLPEVSGDTSKLHTYVTGDPERFVGMRIDMLGPGRSPSRFTFIVVVSVLHGDLDQARRDLARLFTGNLCVHRGTRMFEPDELARASAAMDRLASDKSNGIWGWGPGRATTTQPGQVDVLVLNDRLFAEIEKIGLRFFDLQPVVRPVR